MNYKTIHDNFIKKIRETSATERLARRNSKDPRLASSFYVEIHHIIPRSLGGKDTQSNLIEVLPEEHLFLHMLRYKIYNQREDALAIRFMLNGFDSKPVFRRTKISLTKKIRSGYAWLRTHSSFIRKTHGWQTEDGRKRISEARTGMMPVRDIHTGKMVGAVAIDHPNVLSGKWVHHSKGRIQSQQEIDFKKTHNKGQNNPNASGLTEQFFVEKGLEAFTEFGIILSWGRMLELSNARNFPWIKSLKSRFGGKGFSGYYRELENATQAIYDPYKSRIITRKGVPLQ